MLRAAGTWGVSSLKRPAGLFDGTGLTRIDPSDDEDTYPTGSPDGSKIAYRVCGRIKVIAATGGASTDFNDLYPEVAQKYFIYSGYQFAWK